MNVDIDIKLDEKNLFGTIRDKLPKGNISISSCEKENVEEGFTEKGNIEVHINHQIIPDFMKLKIRDFAKLDISEQIRRICSTDSKEKYEIDILSEDAQVFEYEKTINNENLVKNKYPKLIIRKIERIAILPINILVKGKIETKETPKTEIEFCDLFSKHLSSDGYIQLGITIAIIYTDISSFRTN